MEHIIDGVFTNFIETIQDEIELAKSILGDIKLDSKKSFLNVTDKVLNLPIEKQLYFLRYIVENSDLREDNENIIEFWHQDCFKDQTRVLVALVIMSDDDADEKERISCEKTISDFQKKYNIKIFNNIEFDEKWHNHNERIVSFRDFLIKITNSVLIHDKVLHNMIWTHDDKKIEFLVTTLL